MSKKTLSLCMLAGFSMVCFSIQGLAQTTAKISPSSIPEAAEYVDYDALIRVEDKLIQLINSTNFVSVTNLKAHSATVNPVRRVDAVLPKAYKTPLDAQTFYDQRKYGSLMVGKYYRPENYAGMMARMVASAVVLTEDGICATNYHVLSSIIEQKSKRGDIDSLLYVATVDGKVYTVDSILAYSQVGDAAIFKVNTRGDKLTPIPLGPAARVGAEVRAITHPGESYYYYTQGVVARNVASSEYGPEGNRMEVTCDYALGSSGGPIFDIYGNLIGLVSTTRSLYADPGNRQAQQLVIRSAIPVGTIQSFFVSPK